MPCTRNHLTLDACALTTGQHRDERSFNSELAPVAFDGAAPGPFKYSPMQVGTLWFLITSRTRSPPDV